MKNQTSKAPTGPYQRQKLLEFLEKKAKEEKDWEQNKPFVKEIRGRSKVNTHKVHNPAVNIASTKFIFLFGEGGWR